MSDVSVLGSQMRDISSSLRARNLKEPDRALNDKSESFLKTLEKNDQGTKKSTTKDEGFVEIKKRDNDFVGSPVARLDNVDGIKKFDRAAIEEVLTADDRTLDTMVDKLQSQKAMLKFMDSVEGELGISPARIAEAMTKLDETKLQAPAEETVGEVIKDLNLKPQDAKRMKEMYTEMLDAMRENKELEENDKIVEGSLAAGSLAMLAGLSSLEEKPIKVDEGFAKMQKQELAKTAYQKQDIQANPELSKLDTREAINNVSPNKGVKLDSAPSNGLQKLMNELESVDTSLKEDLDEINALRTDLKNRAMAPQIPQAALKNEMQMSELAGQPSAALNINQMEIVDPKAEKLTSAESDLLSEIDKISPKASKKEIGSVLENQNLNKMQEGKVDQNAIDALGSKKQMNQDQGTSDFLSQSFDQGENKANLKSDGLDRFEVKDKPTRSSSELSTESILSQNGGEKAQKAEQLGKAFVAGTGAAVASSRGENSRAVNQIISQAQWMAHQGGGEMKLQLNGDIGKIDLKVDVLDGKVNVQMLTNSPEAKKLLENNINDLRMGLENHKLHVSDLKIDVAGGFSQSPKDFGQQQQQGFEREMPQMNRQDAQQFMSDFRDNNQAFREKNLFDSSPTIRQSGYKKTSLNPVEVGASRVNRSSTKDGGKLHLVA